MELDIPLKDRPFQLEFRQLKEYYNFKRQFKFAKYDTSKQGIIIRDEYYLINRNWLNSWKKSIKYNEFSSLNLNRDVIDNDYNIFISLFINNINNIKLNPLDNSNIYNDLSEINPFADFVIINKKCFELFKESNHNMKSKIIERPVPLQFCKDIIILHIDSNIKLICFRDDITKKDFEIIIIFKEQKNINKILSDIEKEYFKNWLRNRGFYLEGPDELYIEDQSFNMKIINKNLKLKNLDSKNNIKNNEQNIINENKKLKNELDILKIENEKLNSEITKLNNELMNAKNIIFNMNNIQQNNQGNNNIINYLQNIIQIKEQEINDLKKNLEQNIFINKTKTINFNDILLVHFISIDQNIKYSIKCLKDETFAEVEEKLYKNFPECRERNNNFLCGGRLILRFKKICDNSIKDGDTILFDKQYL